MTLIIIFFLLILLFVVSCTKKERKFENMSIDNPYLPKIEMSEIKEMEFIVHHLHKPRINEYVEEKIDLTSEGKIKIFVVKFSLTR
jgi:hypothetical protein